MFCWTFSPLVDCVYDLLLNGVLSTISLFEYAASLLKKMWVPLRLPLGPKSMSPCVLGVMLFGGYGSSCTSQYVPTTNLQLFKSKLVLTTTSLGESFSDVTFLT